MRFCNLQVVYLLQYHVVLRVPYVMNNQMLVTPARMATVATYTPNLSSLLLALKGRLLPSK